MSSAFRTRTTISAFLLFSLASPPALSLTTDQRLAALENSVKTLKASNTNLSTSNSSLILKINALVAENTKLSVKITSLSALNSRLANQVNAIAANSVLALDQKLYLNPNGDTAVFEGLNLQVNNGLNNTTPNGKGNIIIGYNVIDGPYADVKNAIKVCSDFKYANQEICEAANKTWAPYQHTGSHYLIIGDFHSYTSLGGFVTGYENAATGGYANVLGGYRNLASGNLSIVAGGENTAGNSLSSVTGGWENKALGQSSSISGGRSNTVNDTLGTISGGKSNTVNDYLGSISGGESNTVKGYLGSISGGKSNTVNGYWGSISGGTGLIVNDLNQWKGGNY